MYDANTRLTVGMLMKEMPFPRPAVLVRILARDLKEAIEQHLRAYPMQSGSYPHVSGLRIVYDRTDASGATPEVYIVVRENGLDNSMYINNRST